MNKATITNETKKLISQMRLYQNGVSSRLEVIIIVPTLQALPFIMAHAGGWGKVECYSLAIIP